MPQQSLTDLTVASQNLSLFELLWQLPGELVLHFAEQANTWEMRHGLAERLAGYADTVRAAVASTPSLRSRSDQIAQACAEYAFRSNATVYALFAQLARGARTPLTVEWQGLDNLQRARAGGRPVVVFAPHVGYLYAVPGALAVLGERLAVLGSEVARDVLVRVVPAVAPRFMELIDYLVVPSPGCARAAANTLARGELLVVFPEVNRGATGNLRATTMQFLGRTIWVPTTAARFARMARADILPALVTPRDARQVRIEFGEPVAAPAGREADAATSRQLFAGLERVVEELPHLWLGWPMLDTDMKVPDGHPARRQGSGA